MNTQTIPPYPTPCTRRNAVAMVVAGMLGLALAMGIGRFAYTTILPLMQRDLGLSNAMAGWLAGVNLVGYMLGALACFVAPWAARSHKIATLMALSSVTTTLCMGLTTSDILWSTLRFVSGFNSGMLFVYVTSETTERLIAHGRGNWAGALYSGVGFGVAMTGLFTPMLDTLTTSGTASGDGWSTAWLGFGLIAFLVATCAVVLSLPSHGSAHLHQREHTTPIPVQALYWLTAAYFCEALGYIVSATFLVTIIASNPHLTHMAAWSWVIVGLAIIPSTVLWTWLGRKIGKKMALIVAYTLQAAGIVVCITATTPIEMVFVAVSFGGTFMGGVALTMAEGGRRSPPNGRRIAALLTVAYGIGQIIAPIIAGWLADLTHSFAMPLAMAAGCVVISIVLTASDKFFHISATELSAPKTGG